MALCTHLVFLVAEIQAMSEPHHVIARIELRKFDHQISGDEVVHFAQFEHVHLHDVAEIQQQMRRTFETAGDVKAGGDYVCRTAASCESTSDRHADKIQRGVLAMLIQSELARHLVDQSLGS